jgi:hypothetical protein
VTDGLFRFHAELARPEMGLVVGKNEKVRLFLDRINRIEIKQLQLVGLGNMRPEGEILSARIRRAVYQEPRNTKPGNATRPQSVLLGKDDMKENDGDFKR